MYNTLIAIVEVFLSDVSQPSFPDGMFVPFQLYVLTKGSFFLTLSVFFQFSDDLMRLLQHIESIYYHFY